MATGGSDAIGAGGRALDIREMSFQNVIDQILKPNGVKVGGFPEDMFVDLSEEEQNDLRCNICYLMVNEPRQCDNRHLFCESCIFAWTMTYGENSQKCPVCRCAQRRYGQNIALRARLWDKRVRCPETKCTFMACIKAFLMHNHGRERFSNEGVDLEALRVPRPENARLLVLPNMVMQGATRIERARSIRDQIHQGRLMIHQMMLLLHLEMQLRQQALNSYSQATDPTERLARLDEVVALNEHLNDVEGVLSTLLHSPMHTLLVGGWGSHSLRPESVMALNEQLNEVGGVLSTLLNSPMHALLGGSRSLRPDSTSIGPSQAPSLSEILNQANNDDDSSLNHDDDEDDDDDSSFPLSRPLPHDSPYSEMADIPNGRHLSDYTQGGGQSINIEPRVLLGRTSTSNWTAEPTTSRVVEESTARLGPTSGGAIANSVVRASSTALPRISNASVASTTQNTSVSSTGTHGRDGNAGMSAVQPSSTATPPRWQPQPPQRNRTPTQQANEARPSIANTTLGQQASRINSGSSESIATTARILSGRIRAQASNTLSSSNPATASVSSQASSNNSNASTVRQNSNETVTPRIRDTLITDRVSVLPNSTRPNNARGPVVASSATTTNEERETTRASRQTSTSNTNSTVANRVNNSATRRRTTSNGPPQSQRSENISRRDISGPQNQANRASERGSTENNDKALRYAPRLRQSQSLNSQNRAPLSRSISNNSNTSESSIPSLNRTRDTSNRLRNGHTQASSVTSPRDNSQTATTRVDTRAKKKPPPGGSNGIAARSPELSIRPRRRSEIRWN